jgi:hypothetical protein
MPRPARRIAVNSHRTTIGALALAAALAATAGCAHQSTGGSGRTPAAPGGPAATPGGPSCTSPSAGTVMVTEAASGGAVCLAPGTRLNVFLHGTADRRWMPIQVQGTAVTGAPSGVGTLAIGVTGGFFVAKGPGTVRLTSARPACPGQTTGGGASAGPCAPQEFTMTVVVA